MKRRLIIRPEAEEDIREACDWYDHQREGLSQEFELALDAVLASILRKPELHAIIHKQVRRVLLRRFSYGVLFLRCAVTQLSSTPSCTRAAIRAAGSGACDG